MSKLWWSALSVVFISMNALAHPVTYKGGVAITQTLRPQMARSHFNYSFLRNLSLGLTYDRRVLMDRRINAGYPQLNFLVHRINGSGYQANFYLMSGLGLARDTEKGDVFAAYGAVQADFETRRIYTAALANLLWTDDIVPYRLTARAGYAPYEAKYDQLQAWMVAQIEYAPETHDIVLVTPLMRFFYQSALWELGASLTGEYWLRLMIHI